MFCCFDYSKVMRIIYSAGNRIGANIQLSRFLDNIDKTKHEVKTAAYLKSSYSISNIDWNLNAVHKEDTNDPIKIYKLDSERYILDTMSLLFNDVCEFNPELIICDNEHILSYMAKEIDVPLWYCSPMLLMEAIEWNFGNKINYSYFIGLDSVDRPPIFPEASKYLVYSAFGDLKNGPVLKKKYDDDFYEINKYEWVKPYYKKEKSICIDEFNRSLKLNDILKRVDLKDYFFTDGNTDNLAHAIYNKKKILISPNLKNKESLLNSVLIDHYKIGVDLGQVELMNEFSVEEIENSLDKKLKDINLLQRNGKHLHEMIDEIGSLDIID